ncbi:ABC transporter permease [Georgenia yuyongxinii]|uniref:ABC transporter permease n=1 Tax=Georgenia yuyongxinii TaxID=2589797 RepID=A0A552WL57_9MICO|nr:ABC transporter permease [Georgenia yuyongxinii]TRW43379.1 ABC transporter permease [Georgenia yuyongxinii]
MSSLSTIWLIASREVKTRMMTKANIISLAVMLAVIIVAAFVGNYFLNRDQGLSALQVGVSESTVVLTDALEAGAAQQDSDVDVLPMTRHDAEAALTGDSDTELDAFLDGDPAAPTMVVADGADPELLALVTTATQSFAFADQISELGGNPDTFNQTMASATPTVESLEGEDGGGGADEFDGATYGVAMAMISVLLFALIGSGSLIAMGVVEEKTSRVVEILLATIRPTQLLAGKILGIGIYGLFQVVVLGGALAIAASAIGLMDGLEINLGASLGLMVLWFLLGYALFALLFGGFAALVSRQEDIGTVTTPLMFLLFIPYYMTMFMVPNNPDGTAVKVLSQVPFFAPFMMPVREAFGGLAGWEMPLSIVIALVAIPLLVWVAARVYQRGVLHTGGRMKLSEALKG